MALGVGGSVFLVTGLFGDLQQIVSAFSPLPSPPSCHACTDCDYLLSKMRLRAKHSLLLSKKEIFLLSVCVSLILSLKP